MPITIRHEHFIHGVEEAGLRAEVTALRKDIADLATQVTIQGENMAKELDDLEQEVTRNTSVDEGAMALLRGLADQINSLKHDPVRLANLAANLRASSDRLAQAILENTPQPGNGGQTPTEPTTPGEPTEPTEPTTPAEPTPPEQPTEPTTEPSPDTGDRSLRRSFGR